MVTEVVAGSGQRFAVSVPADASTVVRQAELTKTTQPRVQLVRKARKVCHLPGGYAHSACPGMMANSGPAVPYSFLMRKGRPPLGQSVTVAWIFAGTGPTYSGVKRRSSCTSASVFSICDSAPPMQARLPAAKGR